jgi:hypothetical protein
MYFDSVYGTTAISWRVKTLLKMKAVCTSPFLFGWHGKDATENLNTMNMLRDAMRKAQSTDAKKVAFA